MAYYKDSIANQMFGRIADSLTDNYRAPVNKTRLPNKRKKSTASTITITSEAQRKSPPASFQAAHTRLLTFKRRFHYVECDAWSQTVRVITFSRVFSPFPSLNKWTDLRVHSADPFPTGMSLNSCHQLFNNVKVIPLTSSRPQRSIVERDVHFILPFQV